MGRDKKAQRTKGNKQPSSSGRTADLLGGVGGLVGFGGLQDLGYVPAASQCQGADETVAASLRVALRKMTKKDATTKIKALQEFEALCQTESQEAVLSALPFWPRLYAKLSIDVERRVREGVQSCHRVLSSRVGRQMAPHLKVIMPAWVTAVCDPHTLAADAAAKAFQEAFPRDKRAEVISFTLQEIMSHFVDMLFVQTPQTLSDPKTTAVEDMENKYIRILSSSLQALSWILQLTTSTTTTATDDGGGGGISNGGGGKDQRCGDAARCKKLMEALSEIVGNPAFWKFSKHKNSGVRRAWFDLINDLLVIQPQSLAGSRDDMTSCVLTSLDDSSGNVLPSVWTAFLSLGEVNEGWQLAKAAKSSTNRVLSVLREGCRGAGGVLYNLVPSLLPLLTPSAGKRGGEEEEDKKFYINFCRALSNGIVRFPGRGGGGGAGMGIQALFKCLQFIMTATTISTATATEDCGDLWHTLLEYQVVGLLEASFISTPPLPSSTLYPQVAKFLRLLSTLEESQREGRKIREEKDGDDGERGEGMEGNFSSSSLLSIFWEKFLKMCEEKILMEGKEEEIVEKERMERLSRLSSFLRILRYPDSFIGVKKCLRFAGEIEEEEGENEDEMEKKEEEEKNELKGRKINEEGRNEKNKSKGRKINKDQKREEEEEEEEEEEDKEEDENEEERIFINVTNTAMAQLAYRCHNKQDNHGIYTFLSSIVQYFPCPGVYKSFLQLEQTKEMEEREVTAREVLEKKIMPILEEKDVSSIFSLQSTVEIFSSLYGHLEEAERREVLLSMKSHHPQTLLLLVEKITRLHQKDKAGHDWLLSPQLGNRVLLWVERLFEPASGEKEPCLTPEEAEEVKKLVMFVLRGHGRRGPVVAVETVSEILRLVGRKLKKICSRLDGDGEEMLELAGCVAEINPIHASWKSKGAAEFISALLQALCESHDSARAAIFRGIYLRAIRASVTCKNNATEGEKVSESASPLAEALRCIREKVISGSCTYKLASFLASLTLDLLVLSQRDDGGDADGINNVKTGTCNEAEIGISRNQDLDTDRSKTGNKNSETENINTGTAISGTVTSNTEAIDINTSKSETKRNEAIGSDTTISDNGASKTSSEAFQIDTETNKNYPKTSRINTNLCATLPDTIPSLALDATNVQALLEHVMPVEGQWSELESAISSLYVAPSIFKGAMAFREFPFPKLMAHGTVWHHGHHRTALFTCRVLLGLCEDGEEGDVSLGKYTHLFVHVLHSACSARVMLGHMLALGCRSGVSSDIQDGVRLLLSNSQRLLARLNLGNKRLIAKQTRDRCSEGSSAWCVTLNQLLTRWLEPQEINATRLLQGLDSDALGHAATKQVLLSLLPQSQLQELMEEEIACLSSLVEEPFSAPPCLSILSSILSLLPSDTPGVGETLSSIFTVFFQWREKADGVFLFAEDLHGVAWEDLAVTCAVVRCVSVAVSHHAARLTAAEWDLVLCCLSSWVQSLQESMQSIQEETVAGTFTYFVCSCVKAVADLMRNLEALQRSDKGAGGGAQGDTQASSSSSVSSTSLSSCPPKLYEDWIEFFAPPLFNSLISIFVGLAGSYKQTPSTLLHGVCSAVCSAVVFAGPVHLSQHSLSPPPPLHREEEEEEDEEELHLAESEEALLRHLVSLLASPQPACQGAAYTLLHTAMPALIGSWDGRQQPITEEGELPVRPLPRTLMWILGEVKEGTVGQWGTGGELPPHSPQFPSVVGYMLGWKLTFHALTLTSDPNQHQYCAFLRDKGYIPSLLDNLFSLMPLKPMIEGGGGVGGGSGGDDKTNGTFFNTPVIITPTAISASQFAPHLACQVYYSALSGVPALVRQWFLGLERPCMVCVDTFTATFVSPVLIQQEMAAISTSSAALDNMTIKYRPGAREVVASYTVDEARMELVLRLAANHPLGTVTVEDHKRIGVPLAQWRNWLLGLTTMLSHRNTALHHSLAFWKQNVEKKFKGLEECYICYYVIHSQSHQLPKLLCRTCKKKFHSACLYKWFNSSNNSTCPLCRSLF
ncbi:E3 ubiquitin-protein ligase listerin-like [Portunus trituberculatus]|uniref:E3 ubiquitin-protein ligase listerin-like n=1 Tax=Portunus trituberculatus TaxID=210409 RepID=UPI001E1CC668|nr:E3 ubiquitin-protein ligase listerin-like [Portunus trituberculatus]